QNCILCPANWKSEGGNMCYYHSEDEKSWKQSQQFCFSQNSTLLLIKDATKLELTKKFPKKVYWLGLTFRTQQRNWYWADNTALTEEQKPWTMHLNSFQGCAYFYHNAIYRKQCNEGLNYVCEKPAIQLQRGNDGWQENWFVRPK
ncbi:PREDICTED: C-type lectin domain family 12 member B-like, partial [Mesitornis unicolor]|uniref:C-type lectin domain family 12 member B-like n=1 Tax=Mesitornis unicolor TaxID=54374 RepID=UPI0005289AC1